MRPAAFALLSVFALSAPGQDAKESKTYDLRGPAPIAGSKFEVTTTFEVPSATKKVKTNGRAVKVKEGVSVSAVREVTLVAVEGRKVVKAKTKVTEDATDITTVTFGVTASDTQPGALAEQSVTSSRPALGGDGWKHALSGGGAAPTDEQRKALVALPDPSGGDGSAYPEGKVKVGHAWTTDAKLLRLDFGQWLAEPAGQLDSKFLRVEKFGGAECAVVESRGTVSGKTRPYPVKVGDDDAEAVGETEATVRLVVYRSLKTGVDVKSSCTGTLKATVASEAAMVEIEFEGSFAAKEARAAK